MKQLTRTLRKNQTDAEKRLWNHLRNRALAGYKFRRQYALGPYIVDFICLEKMLVIEVDGGQHMTRQQADQARTHYLQAQGFHVLRFWNHGVLVETEAVLNVILERLSSPSS